MQVRIDDIFSQAKKVVKEISIQHTQAPQETFHKPNVVLFGPKESQAQPKSPEPIVNDKPTEQISSAMEVEEEKPFAEVPISHLNPIQSIPSMTITWIPHSKRNRLIRFCRLARSQFSAAPSAAESIDGSIEDMLNPFESMLKKEMQRSSKNAEVS